MASSTNLCLNPVYKTGDYINSINELKETLDDPVFGIIPKYSANVGVGSVYSYNSQKSLTITCHQLKEHRQKTVQSL